MINKKFKTYTLEPSDGQALLNYKGRISADDLYMQLYEIDEKSGELVNCKEDDEKDGTVFDGDCLSVCAYLKDNNKKVDFIYIDPPYASDANYSKKIYIRNKENPKKMSKEYKTEEDTDNSIGEEIMYGDIWSKEDYLNWLYLRLVALREILSENGSIMVQLDWHIGEYVKVLMDEVFGEENFVNEIIWSYRSGGASKKGSLARKHDNIYFYSKNSDFEINCLTERQYLDKPFMDSKQDENGRYYADTILRDVLEGIIYIVNEDGTVEEFNVRPVLNLSTERLDYNTQKPEGLIKLLIKIATNDGDVVADLFGGSGTTARASYALNRKFITSDIGKNSIQTIRDALKKENAKFEIIDIKDGLDLFRNPTQTMKKIFDLCCGEARNSDSEFSELWDGTITYHGLVQYVKIVDNSKIVDENYIDYILTQIQEDNINDPQEEYLILYVYKDFEITQKAIDKKVKELGLEAKVNLIAVEDILKTNTANIYAPDSAKISVKEVEKGKYKVKIENYFSPYLYNKIKTENERRERSKKDTKKIEISDTGYELIELISIDTDLGEKWNSSIEDKAETDGFIKGEYTIDTNKFRLKIRNIAGDEIVIASEEVK